MKYKVEIINNPYCTNMRLLINGEVPSIYGELEQFQDEPFWNWCDKIFELIFKECNNSDFILSYTGREEENLIMKQLAQKKEYCDYVFVPYKIKDSFQHKMKKLSDLVRENKFSEVCVNQIKAVFVVSKKYMGLKNDICEMAIQNAYCSVVPEFYLFDEFIEKKKCLDDVIFYVSDKIDFEDISQKFNSKFVFGIKMGNENKFCDKIGRTFIYESTIDDFFMTIFECFKIAPLLMVFNKCKEEVRNIGRNQMDVLPKLAELQSIEEPIKVEFETDDFEVGKSVPIKFTRNGLRLIDDLEVRFDVEGIVDFNGFSVVGIAEGETSVHFFVKGERIPFYVKKISVIQRNRIETIKMHNREMIVGEGDKCQIEYDYYPLNADNVDEIIYKSSNENVVKILDSGRVQAVKEGSCDVYVCAEQVSAVTHYIVKPYMKEIRISIDKEITLFLGDKIKISYDFLPKNCIDNRVDIISKNLQIVNVMERDIQAVGYGDTTIVVQNHNGRICREIHVIVCKRKKKGFFARLFGKK